MDRTFTRKIAKAEYKMLIRSGQLSKAVQFPEFWKSFLRLSKDKTRTSPNQQDSVDLVDSMIVDVSDQSIVNQ